MQPGHQPQDHPKFTTPNEYAQSIPAPPAPQSYVDPMPAQSYAAPPAPQSYSAPPAPQQSFAAPAQSYAAPAQSYAAPAPSFQIDQSSKGKLFPGRRKGKNSAGLKMGIVIFLGIILVISGGGIGGYYLGKSAGIADASGGTPDEAYTGKWFISSCYESWEGEISCSYDALWLRESGDISVWTTPYFECSDGMHIYGNYVDDGDNDCIDGTDEGTTKAQTFNPDSAWVSSKGLKMQESGAISYDDYYYNALSWGINDEGSFCFSMNHFKSVDNANAIIIQCQKVWLNSDAIWHKYELLDNDVDKVGYDTNDCGILIRMDRASGPPENDNQAWDDLFSLEVSEAMSSKPRDCSDTTYQDLTEGFDNPNQDSSDW